MRLKKLFLWIGCSILLVLIIALLILNFRASDIADTMLRNQLKNNPIKGYVVEFKKVKVNLLSRSIKVNGIELYPEKNIAESPSDKLILKATLDEIKLAGVKIWKAYKKGVLEINLILIRKPVIKIFSKGDIFQKREGKIFEWEKSTNAEQKNIIKSILVDRMKIENAGIDVINQEKEQSIISTKDFTIEIFNLYSENLQDNSNKKFVFDDLKVSLNSFEMPLPGNMYKLHIDNLKLIKSDSLLTMDSLLLIPEYGKYQFGKVLGKQRDWVVMRLAQITWKGVDFDRLVQHQQVCIRKLEVGDFKVNDFRDKRIPFDYQYFPKLPQQALRNLNKKITVEELKICNGHFTYEEHHENKDKPGMVYISDLEIEVLNISNEQQWIKDHPSMEINIEGKLMGKGLLKGQIDMPLNDLQDRFTFSGSLGKMEIVPLNSMLEPITEFSLKSGVVDHVNFSAKLNNDFATGGTMELLYHDLKVAVLKERKKIHEMKEKGVLSFLANEIIRSDNPSHDHPPKKANLFFERNKNKGLGNYLWKTLLSGIKETIKPGGEKKYEREKEKDKIKGERHHKKTRKHEKRKE